MWCKQAPVDVLFEMGIVEDEHVRPINLHNAVVYSRQTGLVIRSVPPVRDAGYTGLENREQRNGVLLITIYPGGQCSSNRPASLMALRSGNKCALGYGAPAGHQFPSHNRQRALSSPATHLACRFSGRKRVFHHSLRICQGWKAALISPMLLKLHTLKVRL